MEEMRPYIVNIQEHYHKSVVVWAKSDDEATDLADSLCDCGDIDMIKNCYAGRNVQVQGVAGENDLRHYDQYEGEE